MVENKLRGVYVLNGTVRVVTPLTPRHEGESDLEHLKRVMPKAIANAGGIVSEWKAATVDKIPVTAAEFYKLPAIE